MLIDKKQIDPNKIINQKTFLDLGIFKSKKTRIKLLAKGNLKSKINIEVSAYSNSAKQNIEKIGGSLHMFDEKKTNSIKEKKSEV